MMHPTFRIVLCIQIAVVIGFFLYQRTTTPTKTMVNNCENEQKNTHGYKKMIPHLNVLFFIPLDLHEGRSDRWFSDYYEEAITHPGMTAKIWGPDWEGWNRSLKFEENVKQKFGIEFDAVLYEKIRQDDLPREGGPTVVAAVFHEATSQEGGTNDPLWLSHWFPPRDHIMFFTYASDMWLYSNYSQNRLMVHLSHTVRPSTFKKDVQKKRDIDILLVGAISPKFYPLRYRFHNLIKSGVLKGGAHRSHPGYTELYSREQRLKLGWTKEKLEQQVKDYADELGNAKMVICTKSTRGYSLRKYFEAAAAGALIIGNIPDSDRDDEFRKYVVEVHNNETDQQIVDKVKWWIDHPKERMERARKGQEIALSKYPTRHALDQMLEAFADFKFYNVRGMRFPYPFKMDYTRVLSPLRTEE